MLIDGLVESGIYSEVESIIRKYDNLVPQKVNTPFTTICSAGTRENECVSTHTWRDTHGNTHNFCCNPCIFSTTPLTLPRTVAAASAFHKGEPFH